MSPQSIIQKSFGLSLGIITSLLLWPVYLLSLLIPRKKNIWVFGSFQGNFVDNSKYLYLQVKYNNEQYPVKAIWISHTRQQSADIRKRGFESYPRYSVLGIFYSLQASVFIVSWSVKDISFWLSGGATLVNLWHGLPFKKVGKDNDENKKGAFGGTFKNASWRQALEFFINPIPFIKLNYFLSSNSLEMANIFTRTFPAKKLFRSIYPRNEHFLFSDNSLAEFIQFASTNQEREMIDSFKDYSQVWVYMPTFRDNKKDDKVLHSSAALDFTILDEILGRHNVLLLVKYHYVVLQGLNTHTRYKSIKFVDPRMDMYVVLPFTSGLITDYSSVLYDYMLLRKPILFYAFDLESYHQNSRELYFPYNDVACGDKVTTFSELCNWFDSEKFKDGAHEYTTPIQRFWGDISSPNVLQMLYSIESGSTREAGRISTQLVQNG